MLTVGQIIVFVVLFGLGWLFYRATKKMDNPSIRSPHRYEEGNPGLGVDVD